MHQRNSQSEEERDRWRNKYRCWNGHVWGGSGMWWLKIWDPGFSPSFPTCLLLPGAEEVLAAGALLLTCYRWMMCSERVVVAFKYDRVCGSTVWSAKLLLLLLGSDTLPVWCSLFIFSDAWTAVLAYRWELEKLLLWGAPSLSSRQLSLSLSLTHTHTHTIVTQNIFLQYLLELENTDKYKTKICFQNQTFLILPLRENH